MNIGDAKPWNSENLALAGPLEPVFDQRDDYDLTVRGQIPAALRGVYMRNGPNPYFAPDGQYAYPFDGTGMIHAIYLQDGRARYRNRWVVTDELREEAAAGKRLYNSLFSGPPNAILANTHIVEHAGRYLALYEGGGPYELDRDLGTLGRYDFHGKLQVPMSAHPKLDPDTGELLWLSYDLESGTLFYMRAGRSGGLDRCVPIESPWPAMVHDIALTRTHLVAFVCPLVFDLSGNGPPMDWQPRRGSKVLLIPRAAEDDAQVQWLDGAPFFHWHTLNAWADGGRIEVTLPWFDTFPMGGGAHRMELHRIVIDATRGSVTDETLDDQPCEFTRINDAYLGRNARFGYAGLRSPRTGETPCVGSFEAIARYDLQTGGKTVYRFGPGATICEPVFAADPHGRAENDGWILSFVHEAGRQGGSFVILDARQIEAGPVATVELPRRVPAGLHGSWLAA
jgi:carotenoid cleavage dioxygenase